MSKSGLKQRGSRLQVQFKSSSSVLFSAGSRSCVSSRRWWGRTTAPTWSRWRCGVTWSNCWSVRSSVWSGPRAEPLSDRSSRREERTGWSSEDPDGSTSFKTSDKDEGDSWRAFLLGDSCYFVILNTCLKCLTIAAYKVVHLRCARVSYFWQPLPRPWTGWRSGIHWISSFEHFTPACV